MRNKKKRGGWYFSASIKHVSPVMVWILLLGLFFPLLSHVELNSFSGVMNYELEES